MNRPGPQHEPPCMACGRTAGHHVPEGLDLSFVHYVEHEVRMGRRKADGRAVAA